MNVSRRKFLATFSTSVVAACVTTRSAGAGTVLGPDGRKGAAMLISSGGKQKITWNSIFPYIETDFLFSDQLGRFSSDARWLRLVGMTNTDRAAQSFEREPQSFVLGFETWAKDNQGVAPENIYRIEHFALGRFELFVSAGSLEDDRQVYTAVINRVIV